MSHRTNDGTRTIYHRDGTVTIWDVYQQVRRRTGYVSDRTMATLSSPEWERVRRHTRRSLGEDEQVRPRRVTARALDPDQTKEIRTMEKVQGKDVETQGLTQEQVNEYVRHGGALCPFCGTANIEGGEVESEHDGAWQSVKCNQCGATWNDVHRLVAVDWHEGPVYHCLDAEPDGPDYKALAEKLAEACEMALHDQYGELVPDGWDVAEGLRAALAEYKAATEGGAA